MTNKAESVRSDEGRVRLYEAGLLLLPTIPEDELGKAVEDIQKKIEAVARVTKVRAPELRTLAYGIEATVNEKSVEFSKAYLCSMIIEAETSAINAVRELLKSDARVIRSLVIIRTPADLALEEEQIKVREAEAKARGVENEAKAGDKMSDAEMDKMIDDLVVQ